MTFPYIIDMNNYLQTFRNYTLWLQYMDMMDKLIQVPKAERTCNWEMYDIFTTFYRKCSQPLYKIGIISGHDKTPRTTPRSINTRVLVMWCIEQSFLGWTLTRFIIEEILINSVSPLEEV